MNAQDVVICEPVRTPVGADGGVFRDLPAVDLATIAMKGLMDRTGLTEGDVDDVLFGQGYANSEAPAIGRVAALNAGLGVGVGGLQLDRRCASGVQSIVYGALQVGGGWSDVVIAGGAESMSQAEHYLLGLRHGTGTGDATMYDRIVRGRVTAGGHRHPVPGGMLETAENVRVQYGISREEQDEFAVRSHQKASRATREGLFTEQIVPVELPGSRRTPARTVTEDEQIRHDVDPEKMAGLRAIRSRLDEESTVTAGNACGQSDGASMCVVTTREKADQLGLRPFVRLVSWAVAGVPPEVMGIGPVPAAAKALDRAGLTMADMDLIEVNEAFAVQVIASMQEWGLGAVDEERLNVNGSAIALGHPAGATGARILTTLAYEMKRRGSRYGLETMCMGGGQGFAAVFERVV